MTEIVLVGVVVVLVLFGACALFGKGRDYEQEHIIRWLRTRSHLSNATLFAQQIARGEHR